MIPTIEKVLDMKSRFPALNNFEIKLEERYRTLCKIIDSSSVSDEIKNVRKNTYYSFLMIIKKLLNSNNYHCIILLRYRDSNLLIDSKRLNVKIDDELLLTLLSNYDLIDFEYCGDSSPIYSISLKHEKVRERTNEN